MRRVDRAENLRSFPFSDHRCGRFHTSYNNEMVRFQTTAGLRVWVVGIVCYLGILPFILNDYGLHLLSIVAIYAIVAVGLTVMTGYTGQLSLAHGALFGVGACTGALLSFYGNVPFFLTIPLAGVAAMVFGAIFAIASLRLKPIFLPMATLAGQFILQYLLLYHLPFNGASKTLPIPKPVIGGLDLGSNLSLFYINAISLLAVMWLVDNLRRSKTGRAFSAIKQNERAATAMGIVVYQHKLLAFSISAFLAGIAGALFAFSTEILAPSFFNLTLSIEFLAMIVIGGMGSISGAVIGAGAIVFLKGCAMSLSGHAANPNAFFFGNAPGVPIYEFLLGFIFVIFIIFRPEGLVNLWFRVKQAFNRWPFS